MFTLRQYLLALLDSRGLTRTLGEIDVCRDEQGRPCFSAGNSAAVFRIRLGGRIRVENNVALVEGGCPLRGTSLRSTDLRAGAALMLAGLMAEGETLLSDPSGHIERGYQNLPEKLRLLGADIERLEDYPV